MNWRDRLTADPLVCHGQVCVKGTRVMASVVMDNLATGMPIGELLTSYPSLEEDDVLSVLAYGAELARERRISLEPSAPAE